MSILQSHIGQQVCVLHMTDWWIVSYTPRRRVWKAGLGVKLGLLLCICVCVVLVLR